MLVEAWLGSRLAVLMHPCALVPVLRGPKCLQNIKAKCYEKPAIAAITEEVNWIHIHARAANPRPPYQREAAQCMEHHSCHKLCACSSLLLSSSTGVELPLQAARSSLHKAQGRNLNRDLNEDRDCSKCAPCIDLTAGSCLSGQPRVLEPNQPAAQA